MNMNHQLKIVLLATMLAVSCAVGAFAQDAAVREWAYYMDAANGSDENNVRSRGNTFRNLQIKSMAIYIGKNRLSKEEGL
jgi:hypothetical protein